LAEAERQLTAAVAVEPFDAFSLQNDQAHAELVRDVLRGSSPAAFSWEVTPWITGRAPDAGLSLWITEDTGFVGDRTSGPNSWLAWLWFTERTSDRLRADTREAQDAEVGLEEVLVARADTLDAFVGGSSGDLSWLTDVPPRGSADGRSWSVSLSSDGSSVVIAFIDDRSSPLMSGMAWVRVPEAPD
jgi:hypothetical protein